MIKLAKMKMPGKKAEAELDMSELHEGSESPEFESGEEEAMADSESAPVSELAEVSDEDLIAEMKSRGLNLDSLDSEGAEPSDEEQYI